jgi:hypothetical protein
LSALQPGVCLKSLRVGDTALTVSTPDAFLYESRSASPHYSGMAHPVVGQLEEYALGRNHSESVAKHVAACAECREVIADVHLLRAALALVAAEQTDTCAA